MQTEIQTENSSRIVKYRLAGEVQNIGFRRFLKDEAQKYNLLGFAANENDGSLTVLLSGDEGKIGKIQPILHQGPPSARVVAVTEVLPDDADFPLPSEFAIR